LDTFDWDIVLLTQKEYVAPQAPNEYVQNILTEDQLVSEALTNKGFCVTRKSWDDPNFDWKKTRFALFRATWDYFHRFPEFQDWLNRAKEETQLINSSETLLWNMDKHYLLDLEAAGVSVVPTSIAEAKSNRSLHDFYEQSPYVEAILKPTVSGSARHTYRLRRDNIEEHAELFEQLIQKEAMMLQPFKERILTEGEISLIYFGKTFSHAVRKRAKKGDFRVQDDFGGTLHDHDPDAEELSIAEAALDACPSLPVYARVDLVRNKANEPLVMELELIEPELWFRRNREAARKLTDTIIKTHL
jgi:glutathione synthase/RimK-type ligase-like ATP-grasp enzyme